MQAEKYLAALVDGELRGWWRRRAVVKHLEKCVLCRQRLDAQRQIKNLLHSKVRRIKAPHELATSIHRRLADESHSITF